MILDTNNIYILEENDTHIKAVMEHLVGGTVESVKSDGFWLFSGLKGKALPLKKLSDYEAKELAKKAIKIL